jgi:hypothetical protein
MPCKRPAVLPPTCWRSGAAAAAPVLGAAVKTRRRAAPVAPEAGPAWAAGRGWPAWSACSLASSPWQLLPLLLAALRRACSSRCCSLSTSCCTARSCSGGTAPGGAGGDSSGFGGGPLRCCACTWAWRQGVSLEPRACMHMQSPSSWRRLGAPRRLQRTWGRPSSQPCTCCSLPALVLPGEARGPCASCCHSGCCCTLLVMKLSARLLSLRFRQQQAGGILSCRHPLPGRLAGAVRCSPGCRSGTGPGRARLGAKQSFWALTCAQNRR